MMSFSASCIFAPYDRKEDFDGLGEMEQKYGARAEFLVQRSLSVEEAERDVKPVR